MAWSRTTRKDYRRDGARYESDVTGKEWVIVEPMIPKQGRLGRPRQTDPHDVFNAIQYVLATRCQWRALPGDFPPHSTVMNYFCGWRDSGVFDRMMAALRGLARAEAGRRTEPTAAIIDSQSVKTTDPRSPSLGIYGIVASLGGGPEESVFKDLRMDGSLPLSCKGCRTDSGEFSGLGAAGRMSIHDAQGCLEPETTAVFGNRRLMTYGTDS